MGTLFGVYLARAGFEVSVLVRDPQARQRIRRKGLILHADIPLVARVHVQDPEEPKVFQDLVLLAVKSYDTLSAIQSSRSWCTEETLVVFLQNGLSHVQLMARQVGKTFLGVTTLGSTLQRPGEARLGGLGPTRIGSLRAGQQADADRIAMWFSQGGWSCVRSREILIDLWRKVIVNACINPLAGVLGLCNGELYERQETRELMRQGVQEAVKVARAEVDFPESEETCYRRVLQVCRRTHSNQCSMLQDIRRGRRTEIDSINGEIVKAGTRQGIPTPFHALLAGLVRSIESKGLRFEV